MGLMYAVDVNVPGRKPWNATTTRHRRRQRRTCLRRCCCCCAALEGTRSPTELKRHQGGRHVLHAQDRGGTLDRLIGWCLVEVRTAVARAASCRAGARTCAKRGSGPAAFACSTARCCCGCCRCVTLPPSSSSRALRHLWVVVVLPRGAVVTALAAVVLRAVPTTTAAGRAGTTAAAALPPSLLRRLPLLDAVTAAVPTDRRRCAALPLLLLLTLRRVALMAVMVVMMPAILLSRAHRGRRAAAPLVRRCERGFSVAVGVLWKPNANSPVLASAIVSFDCCHRRRTHGCFVRFVESFFTRRLIVGRARALLPGHARVVHERPLTVLVCCRLC